MKAFFIFAGSSKILCAILLSLSWFSIGIFMWNEISTGNYLAMVQNPAWLPVNVIYLLATLLLIPGIIAIYLQGLEDKGIPGQFALWITLLAIIWYSCIQFYETLFWPVIASESPLLFKEVGFNPSNTIIYTQLILSAVAWGAGFILLGIVTSKTSFISKRMVFIFTLGALLFGVGMMFPIRTVGVLLFSYGLIKYGIALRRNVTS